MSLPEHTRYAVKVGQSWVGRHGTNDLARRLNGELLVHMPAAARLFHRRVDVEQVAKRVGGEVVPVKVVGL